jgi:hypothetical protein
VEEIGQAEVIDVSTLSGEEPTIFATLEGQADGSGHEIVVTFVAV